MSHVDIKKAESHLTELIERAKQGEDIVITKSDQPLAKLVAFTSIRRRKPGSAKGLVHIHEDFDAPLDEFREYMQ